MLVDAIGIVRQIGEVSQITTKMTQKQTNKRDVIIVDMTMHAVRITLWGRQAEEASSADWVVDESVLAIKGAKVSDFNGRTLSTMSSSIITLNPDIKESHELRGWHDTVGCRTPLADLVSVSTPSGSSSFTATATGSTVGAGIEHGSAGLESRKFICQIREENLGQQLDKVRENDKSADL